MKRETCQDVTVCHRSENEVAEATRSRRTVRKPRMQKLLENGTTAVVTTTNDYLGNY